MKKTAGFTLIELVIVIVILGILGAVAAPRFLNLQGDAYGANVKSLAASLQSGATLSHTKAILDGKDGETSTNVAGYSDVTFKFGFPQASKTNSGILGTLQAMPSDTDYEITTEGTSPDFTAVVLQPQARKQTGTIDKCFVKYTAAVDKDTPAKVEFNNDCD